MDNCHASRYVRRVTNKKNLEASNELFVQFVEEVHRRGMKVILDGVFNHCGSFNKWMDRERIYEGQEAMRRGHMWMRRALIAAFSNFIQKNGRIIRIMMAGGGMIHCRS